MLNNNIQGRPLAKRCLEKCWEIEKEQAGELQTLAVSMASSLLTLVQQLPNPEDEKYIEHYVRDIWKGCDFIIAEHRKRKKLEEK